MKLKNITLFGFITLLFVFTLLSLVDLAAGHYEPVLEEITFTGTMFAEGAGDGFEVMTDGLRMAETAVTTLYTSPEIEAPMPFNVVVPQWQATLPADASLNIMIRTRTQQGVWSEWQESHENHDWTLPEEDLIVGEMLAIPAVDTTHTHIQFMISMSRYLSLSAPELNTFTLTFIDSTAGPTIEEMVMQQQAIDLAKNVTTGVSADYLRPTVISRDVWCVSVDCDYTDGLAYSPATHMVVHHTVSNNSSSDWAAVVRAIWSFHTYSRAWGDIGYNYLIDMNGIIYEGHMNDDYETLDVVGTHASGANTGAMGVSLIGTFTAPDYPNLPGIEPPDPMQDSLVELLSWKADQRDIDVYDASRTLPYVEWGLPHLMGHRDAYGTTECPGDQAYALLPELRDRVAANIGLANPYINVDELSADFTKSNANWYEGNNECGTNGHSFYTWSTTDPAQSVNWGEWRPQIPADGRYQIEVRVPFCATGRAETDGAMYTVNHVQGSTTISVSQEANLGLWVNLGEYDLAAGNGNVIHLTDLTTTDDGLGLWFDDMRLLRLSPTLSTIAPADALWINQPTVDFAWALSDSSDVQTTTLQISTNVTMSPTLVSELWAGETVTHTHLFNEDYAALYWQVSMIISGTKEVILSQVSQFGIDTAVPTTAVNNIFQYPDERYQINWHAEDTLSGIAAFNVSSRTISETTWTPWLTGTLNSTATFYPADPAETYEFRVVAIDVAGNVETKTAVDISTQQAILLDHAIMLPLVMKGQ
ncbi:MAG: hypothetical protein GY943_15395 [Chloroflexi bacterium]|nr:hypothetical protein [Chloroflexota bacterium]